MRSNGGNMNYNIRSKKVNGGTKIWTDIVFKDTVNSTSEIAGIINENYDLIVEEVAKQQGLDKSQLENNPKCAYIECPITGGFGFVMVFKVKK
jgi:hypothetical protein